MNQASPTPLQIRLPALARLVVALVCAVACGGCYAPLHSYGIPARCLPDSFRTPTRAVGTPLNLSSLAIPPQKDYLLGPNDILEVTVHGLYPNNELRPLPVPVMSSGEVQLPVIGPVNVGGMNVMQAQVAITKAYENGFIKEPRTNVNLKEKATTSVMVLGEVTKPGVYLLPKYENDVAHAIASAGGIKPEAAYEIEIHRRVTRQEVERAELIQHIRAAEGMRPKLPPPPAARTASPDRSTRIDLLPETISAAPDPDGRTEATPQILRVQAPQPAERIVAPPAVPVLPPSPADPMRIVKIPLRGQGPVPFTRSDIMLNPGDVVVVPSRAAEVFYVTGRLSATNFVKFSIGERDREVGAGFVLPRDRDIDVVFAVAMAGYIDPIESPTTVTVQRQGPDGQPLLILVDLIKARYDYRETVMVRGGDIIYLNPDKAWWGRHTFERVVPELISIPYRKLIGTGNNNNNN